METATFRGRRGIAFVRALGGRAVGWRLVVDKPPLVPVGEAFANIVPDPTAAVMGVLYEIDEADLAHLDLTEGVLIGNYRRITIPVAPLSASDGLVEAFVLVSDRHAPDLLPSRRYMACLVAGAEEHGLPADWIAVLRGVPARDQTAEAAAFRPVLDSLMRKPRG
jgi:gamma-glutamylcyclotransferase (GGCT)/AIG2-like uncharacterized protein YtfP